MPCLNKKHILCSLQIRVTPPTCLYFHQATCLHCCTAHVSANMLQAQTCPAELFLYFKSIIATENSKMFLSLSQLLRLEAVKPKQGDEKTKKLDLQSTFVIYFPM